MQVCKPIIEKSLWGFSNLNVFLGNWEKKIPETNLSPFSKISYDSSGLLGIGGFNSEEAHESKESKKTNGSKGSKRKYHWRSNDHSQQHRQRNQNRFNSFSSLPFALCWFPFTQDKDKESIQLFDFKSELSDNTDLNENLLKIGKLLAEFIPSYTFVYDFMTLMASQQLQANTLSAKDKEWIQKRWNFLFREILNRLKKFSYVDVVYSKETVNLCVRFEEMLSSGALENQLHTFQSMTNCEKLNIDPGLSILSFVHSHDFTVSKEDSKDGFNSVSSPTNTIPRTFQSSTSLLGALDNELVSLRTASLEDSPSNEARQYLERMLISTMGLAFESINDSTSFHYFYLASLLNCPFSTWKCGMILENSPILLTNYNMDTIAPSTNSAFDTLCDSIIKNQSSIQSSQTTQSTLLSSKLLTSSNKVHQLYMRASSLGFSNALCDLARHADSFQVKELFLEEAVRQKSSRAMHELGLLYTQDPKRKIQYGFPLLQKSSTVYAPAMYSYGKLAVLGEISALSAGQGVLLLEEAAELGFPEAMFSLSYIYDKYDHNQSQSMHMLRKAAASGHREAQYELAMCYNIGEKIERNLSKSFQLLKSASELGHLEATFQLAQFYEIGRGTEMSLEEAFKLYSILSDHRDKRALFKKGVFLRNGQGVEQNEDLGLSLIFESAKDGNPEACCWLGTHYEESDMYLAFEWFERAISIDAHYGDARSKRRQLKYRIMNYERKIRESP